MQSHPTDRHPGISMSHIRFGDGVMGVLFGLGLLVVFLTVVPPIRWFLLASLPFAFLVAGALWYWHKHRAVDLILMDSLSGKPSERKVK